MKKIFGRFNRRRTLIPGLMLALICAVVGVTAWSATPALSVKLVPTPTHELSFGQAVIAKSTITPLPTTTPTGTSVPQPMSAFAEVIPDTPRPEFFSPVSANNSGQADSSTTSYTGNKYILVDISDQQMDVYEGDALIYSFVASTGMNNATSTGVFSVLDKIPNAYGATWNIWMPNWLGIYWAGNLENGIHALPILPNGSQLWAGYLGTPISFGCIVLGANEAQMLYEWAEVGTPVEIRW